MNYTEINGCMAENCMFKSGKGFCGLKGITIKKDGKCAYYCSDVKQDKYKALCEKVFLQTEKDARFKEFHDEFMRLYDDQQ